MLDKELADQLTKEEKLYIQGIFEKELHTLIDCYSGPSIEDSAKDLLTALAKTAIALRVSPEDQKRTSEVVANIIVDAVPEDELIKMIKEAVDDNEKKKANPDTPKKFGEGVVYTS